jgi:hypothetical protein
MLPLIALALLAWLVWPGLRDDPKFGGKTMNEWLVDLDRTPSDRQFAVAVAIGPRLVPYLSHAALRPDTWWTRTYDRSWVGAPGWIQRRMPRRLSAPLSREQALVLLEFYDTRATNALPILRAGVLSDDARVRTNALVALGRLRKLVVPPEPAMAETPKTPPSLNEFSLSFEPIREKPVVTPFDPLRLGIHSSLTYEQLSGPASTQAIQTEDLTYEPKQRPRVILRAPAPVQPAPPAKGR